MKRKVKFFTEWLILFCLILTSFIGHSQSTVFRPYLLGGLMLTPPSASDLGYEIIGGGDVEQYIDVNKSTYTLGTQVLFGLKNKTSLKAGIDLGFGKLFNSTYDAHNDALHEDKESALKFLFLTEYNPAGKSYFFQGGVGPNLVLWNWSYDYQSIYQDVSEDDGGSSISPEIMAAFGANLVKSENLNVPLIIRFDCLIRHGIMLSANIGLGFTLNF